MNTNHVSTKKNNFKEEFSMTINKTQENGKITLALNGRLDTTTAPQLQDVLIPAFDEAKEITLDFSPLVYVSSAGLRVLLMGQKTAKAKGGTLTVCNVSDEIMEVFEMTGFADMLTIK
jgi:anti-anti-sigma factor